ncbi:hypothetical protein ACFSCW_05455 [Sphingomonas tabacisoli]|uniref:Uncharacterized protein n=1 Tax=Sphingomonas tabacisoli TaxID=2249466 RepID=A0ABW4I004_9SPHN
MRKHAGLVLAIFSAFWIGWIALELLGSVMGDCDYAGNADCKAMKDYAPALIFWRGLAVELAASVIYLTIRKR